MNMCERKYWHCGHDGHNSRTCKKGGCTEFKLFGVQIAVPNDDGDESTIRKSKSMGNLQSCNPLDNAAVAAAGAAAEPSGYLSDGLVHQSSKSHDRKRDVTRSTKPWSEDEHRSFLAGLEKLGKGDWKGISSNFVPSRSSTQVASHAQKYFNRLSATEKKRRRASVFDIPLTQTNQPSRKADESSFQASSSAAASKNVFELKGQPSMQAHVANTSERPPLSPMKRNAIPGYLSNTIPYQPKVSSYINKGFPTQAVKPTLSWVPVVNFSGQGSVFLSNIHGFVPQPLVSTTQQGSSSQPGSAIPTTNNDELNLNIRKLALG